MANQDEINFLFVVENLEDQEGVRKRRNFYKRCNAFELEDKQFMKMFRLSKALMNNLIELVTHFVVEQSRASALSVKIKTLLALNFYATGSYQTPVGMNINMGVSQSSVSRSLKEITETLNRPEIFDLWVQFPRNLEEMDSVRQKFYEKFNMPGVIGCIDCTHVAIYPPSENNPVHPEYIFISRKNYHSINTQLICDSNLRILHVNARFPGSCHDSHIWNNSNVEPLMKTIFNRGHEGYFLLGDSGYPLRPWLLTPLQTPEGPNEELYNRTHKSIRSMIERCIGMLKMRFRCLLKHRVLHYDPESAMKIIKSCVVLHNMCIENNLDYIGDDVNEVQFDFGIIQPAEINVERVNPDLLAGRRIQQRIIHHIARH